MVRYSYPHTIDNGGGERLTFLRRVQGPYGERLEVDNTVAPGAGPPMHSHRYQTEALTVVQGRIGYQRIHGGHELVIAVRFATALVIGRKTFEKVLTFDAWPYGQKPVFVLSARPLVPTPAGAVVERMSGAPADIVSQLAARGIRHVYVDGGITIQRFLQAGLIQRLIITRVPVLIGAGIPLFGALLRDTALEHVATRQCASGLVQSEYVVAA